MIGQESEVTDDSNVEPVISTTHEEEEINNSNPAVDKYLLQARKAENLQNYLKAEKYANKVLKIVPGNYEAWFIKGKAAGFVSTLGNNRLKEAFDCFSNAVNNVLAKQRESFTTKLNIAIEKLCVTVITMPCDNFINKRSSDNLNIILAMFEEIKSYINEPFTTQSNLSKTRVLKSMGTILYDKAQVAYINHILTEYNNNGGNGKAQPEIWKEFITESYNCIALIDKAVESDPLDSAYVIPKYKMIITILDAICYSYTKSSQGDTTTYTLDPEKKGICYARIVDYHNKIKQFNPDYKIPQESGSFTRKIILIGVVLVIIYQVFKVFSK